MPRGRLTKVDMESRVNRLYEELDNSDHSDESKWVAKDYLWKVMLMMKEYSN